MSEARRHRFPDLGDPGRLPAWVTQARQAASPVKFPNRGEARRTRYSSLPPPPHAVARASVSPPRPRTIQPPAQQATDWDEQAQLRPRTYLPPAYPEEQNEESFASGEASSHDYIPRAPATPSDSRALLKSLGHTDEEVRGFDLPPVEVSPQFDTPPPGSASVMPPPLLNNQALASSVALMEAEARAEARSAAFAQATVEMAAARAKAAGELEAPLLDLAVEIAQALIEREMTTDPHVHKTLARTALATLGDLKTAKLRASREAFTAIVDAFHGTNIEVEGIMVQVTLDPALEGLGCVAENENARVDGRLQERLRAVSRTLQEERRRRAVERAE